MAEQPQIYSQEELLMLDEDTLDEYLQLIMELFGENLHQLSSALALQYSTLGICVCKLLAQMKRDNSYFEVADILKGDANLIQVEAIRAGLRSLKIRLYQN